MSKEIKAKDGDLSEKEAEALRFYKQVQESFKRILSVTRKDWRIKYDD